MRITDPTRPRPFEELADLIGLEAAGDMLEAAAPAVAEAGADIQQTGAILLAAVRGLHRTSAITPRQDLAIVEAARAYITFPKRPEVTDPTASPSWDEKCERHYYALRDAVLGEQASGDFRPNAIKDGTR